MSEQLNNRCHDQVNDKGNLLVPWQFDMLRRLDRLESGR